MKSSPKWKYWDDLDGFGEPGHELVIGTIKTILSKDPYRGWSFNTYSIGDWWQLTGTSDLSLEKTKLHLESIMFVAIFKKVINGQVNFDRFEPI